MDGTLYEGPLIQLGMAEAIVFSHEAKEAEMTFIGHSLHYQVLKVILYHGINVIPCGRGHLSAQSIIIIKYLLCN